MPARASLGWSRTWGTLLLAASAGAQRDGAPHWAFVSPFAHANVAGTPLPDSGWCRSWIDRHVLDGLQANGLQPSPPAEPAVLLRRVHAALTGLPPSPADVAAFVADPSDAAYERIVDALLRSDACAEHMATPWLDLARFADTYGYQSDMECRTWPWRDWLLRAFGSDLPWERFVTEIVAGDLLPNANVATRTATAFWRLHRMTNEGGSIDEEWRQEYIADRVDTFGAAFLGLTVGCARCHDHKSDPITQREYYQLAALFTLDEAGLAPYATGVTPQPALRLATPEQDTEIVRLQAAADAEERVWRQVREQVRVRANWAATAPVPIARFDFATIAAGKCADQQRPGRTANVPSGITAIAKRGDEPGGVRCDGDSRIVVPDLPAFTRDDAFSVRLVVWIPDRKTRAVLLHTSQYTQDADTQGYQLLLKDGRLAWEIVHHWPASAIAVQSHDLPLQRWIDVVATYDGTSRLTGLGLFVDGEPGGGAGQPVRRPHDLIDRLTGPATVRQLELGGRDRDHGFAGGGIARFELFDSALSWAEARVLAGMPPRLTLRHHLGWRDPALAAAAAKWRDARVALHRYVEAIPELMVMARPDDDVPPTYLLRRGAYDQPDRSERLRPGVPAVLALSQMPARDRLDLAKWLVHREHPLAARVAVDRLWAQCFGRGLVPTPDNFGKNGVPPRQQRLLDQLARSLVFETKTMKGMLRQIVLSATFRQSSTANPAAREADPDNEWLARGPTWRLSAEALRDQALAASGLLHHQLGGPSVKPWQPPGLWHAAGAGWGGADYQPDTGANAHRRSLYTFRKRTAPPPNMLAFDGTSREVCVVRRQPTDTPQQALVLLGDPVFTECAAALAARANELAGADLDARLAFVFTSLAARALRAAELEALRALHANVADAANALALVASAVMASDAAVVVR
jgi:hypothetical protein